MLVGAASDGAGASCHAARATPNGASGTRQALPIDLVEAVSADAGEPVPNLVGAALVDDGSVGAGVAVVEGSGWALDAVVADVVEALITEAPHTVPTAVSHAANAHILAPNAVPVATLPTDDGLVLNACDTIPVGVGWAHLAEVIHALEVA